MDILNFLLAVLGPTVAVATAVFAWYQGRSRAKAKELKDLEATVAGKVDAEDYNTLVEAVGAQERRLSSIEGEMKHLPDKEMVTAINLALARLEGTIGRFEEKLSAVGHTVGLIDEQLREARR